MGIVALTAFFWSMKSGQYEDLSGDAERILFEEDFPLQKTARPNLKDDTKEAFK
jgi:cbb3-type cytochrome oxidase maturation protein